MSERMKLLIAYDGSGCADAALDDLRLAGLPREAEALIFSVVEVWLPPPPPSSYDIVEQAMAENIPVDLKRAYAKDSPAMRQAQHLALNAGERVQAIFPDWEVHVDTSCGSPARELITKADRWKPDLIVVGSHGRSALGRIILGSVSQKLVTEAHCSVRVARGHLQVDDSPVRIVIGVDGSPGAEAAVREVAARPWPMNSEARVTIVDDPLVPTSIGPFNLPFAGAIRESNLVERAWVKKVVGKAAQVLRSAELTVSTAIEEGDPKRVLVEAAERWGADSIFVGSRGFNRLERFLLGSVSTAVVTRAHCSVEVVRARQEG